MRAAARSLYIGLVVLAVTAGLIVWMASTELSHRRSTPPPPVRTVILGY